VIRHIEVEDFAPAMFQHQEDEQDLQPDGRNRKEVSRNDLIEMIAQERSPGLRGRWSPNAPQNPRDAAFRYSDPEHLQLAVDSRCSPQRIGHSHSQDQLSKFSGNGWSS
jgi:hypothetical protein